MDELTNAQMEAQTEECKCTASGTYFVHGRALKTEAMIV